MSYLSVSEAARRLGGRPRDISDLLYQRRVSDERCPVVSGRRLIPLEYLPVIEAALLDRLPKGGTSAPGPGVPAQEGLVGGCVGAVSPPGCLERASHIAQARKEDLM